MSSLRSRAFSAPDRVPNALNAIEDGNDIPNRDSFEDVEDGKSRGYSRLVDSGKERSNTLPSVNEGGKTKSLKSGRNERYCDEVPSYPRTKHRKVIGIESMV